MNTGVKTRITSCGELKRFAIIGVVKEDAIFSNHQMQARKNSNMNRMGLGVVKNSGVSAKLIPVHCQKIDAFSF